MSGILDVLNEKEKEAEKEFLNYIETQKETAQMLKNSLLGIKDITTEDTKDKIITIKKQLSQISTTQEEEKEMVMKTFTDFQQMHNEMMNFLESLLKKGDQITIQDIKKIIKYNKINNPIGLMSERVN
jgi:hypothetical protein